MRRAAALSAVLVLLFVVSHAAATVDFFGSATTCGGVAFNPGDTYPLFRGRSVTVSIEGFAVDDAKEVQLHGLPGVRATVKNRKHGLGSMIDVELAVDAGAALSTGEIRLRYDVEVAGFDRIPAQVFDFPRVDALSFQAGPTVSKAGAATNLLPGLDAVLVLTGKSLLDARPRIPFGGADRFTNVSVLDASDTTLKVALRPVRVGAATLSAKDFRIEKLRCVESPSGGGSIDVTVAVPPTPTPTPRPPVPNVQRPGVGSALMPLPTATPTPNAACQKDRDRDLARLSADAARCGDTAACVQIRKNEQKAIEDRYQSCLARGGP